MPQISASSFLDRTFRAICPQDNEWRDRARARLSELTMPFWALGDLMDLAVDLVGITRSLHPPVARKHVVVMVGDHGVATEGVSQYPVEVTGQMLRNMVNGGAGINALASQAGAEITLVFFISKFRSFFAKNLRIFLRVFRKITAIATALTTPNAPLIGLFGANIGHGKKTKVFVVNREHLCPSLLTMKQKFTSLSI